ncbi:hypothetical protein N7532_006244 [Penicillium argentinense]|uniref:Uncharacterized protein n=1 Tax=Penicillium argentinense TaxID=1131581 RepID=A0A9W9FFG0_9EURO|nr:uncharacterized protein N7532_006244 [Penicillium argentinense]KAJ5099243.1 hypothetical protein N7532_006244 [Penicillium argentinense]
MVNRWRNELDLDKLAMFEELHLAEILKVPFAYSWSPALISNPLDWPSYAPIDVSGFFFRGTSAFEPPMDLQGFYRLVHRQ